MTNILENPPVSNYFKGVIVDTLAHTQLLKKPEEVDVVAEHEAWLSEGGSIINVFTNHRNIWEHPVVNEQHTEPMLRRAGVRPQHFVFVSIKFSASEDSAMPTMGEANSALQGYCRHRNIEILYTMPDKLRENWLKEINSGQLSPVEIAARHEWIASGDDKNSESLFRLAEAMEQEQVIADVFIEGTRNSGMLERGEKLLDFLYLTIKRRHKSFPDLRKPKIATYIMDKFIDIQSREDQEHGLRGFKFLRHPRLIALPGQTLDELRELKNKFHWNEKVTSIHDQTVYMADVILKNVAQHLSAAQRGPYAQLIEAPMSNEVR